MRIFPSVLPLKNECFNKLLKKHSRALNKDLENEWVFITFTD